MNRFCSIFSQLLKLVSRLEFEGLVKEIRAERHARGFACGTSSWRCCSASLAGRRSPDPMKQQGLRRAQRTSNLNRARPVSHPITT